MLKIFPVSLSNLCTEVDYQLTDIEEGLIVLQNPCAGSSSRPASSESLEDIPIHVVYRVSPQCLSQASPYFKAMFDGSEEAGEDFSHDNESGICLEISQEWDPAALLVILQIGHSKFDDIPATIPDVEFLGKLVVIADYFKCLGILKPFVEKWVSSLGGPWNLKPATLPDDVELPDYFADVTSVRESTIWMYVCWKLSFDEHFKKTTISLIFNAKGPIDSLGLLFNRHLIGDLDNEREWRLQKFFGQIDESVSDLAGVEGDEGLEKQSRLLYLEFLDNIVRKNREWRCRGEWPYHVKSFKEILVHFWTKKKEMTGPDQMESMTFSDRVTGCLVDMLQAVEDLGNFDGLNAGDYL